MAIKYVDTSATYNGDGSSKDPAAGAGQPGAWNDLKAVLANTGSAYAIANGDTVYIRSDDGANPITISVTSTITMATRGTRELPITWVVDDGTIWPNGGELKLSFNSTSAFTFKDYNHFLCNGRKLRLYFDNPNATFTLCTLAAGIYDGLIWETKNAYVAWNQIGLNNTTMSWTKCRNCLFDISSNGGGATSYGIFSSAGSSVHYLFDNCDFDIGGAPSGVLLFSSPVTSNQWFFRGCRVLNSTETTRFVWVDPTVLAGYGAVKVSLEDCNLGYSALAHWAAGSPSTANQLDNFEIVSVNTNNSLYQFRKETLLGIIDWTPGQNYPVLNSILPEGSNTPWSIRVSQPLKLSSPSAPFTLSTMKKFYNLAPASKTITVEMLACDTFGTPTKDKWWIDVYYVDNSTGLIKCETTKALSGNLVASTAGWSATTYGARSYNKFKLEITTAASIKQYSDITVIFRSAFTFPNVNDYYFIDPDFGVN